MVAPVKFAHVVLKTSRYGEMLEWWCRLLDAKVRHGSDFISFLSYDDEHHRLAIVNFPNLETLNQTSAGVEHVAFTFASLDDLFSKYEELSAAGVLPYWTINHGMTLSAYYRDPDGNQVELQVDSMDNQQADAFMNSPTFATNPIGIDVDFPSLITKRKSGVALEELLAYRSDS